MALARLAALDRRLPFGSATLVGATALGVLLAGTAAAFVKDPAPPASAAPAAPAQRPPGGGSAPEKAAKPDEPIEYLLDVATVLPDFRKLSDRVAGAGPMDLEKAAVVEAGGEEPTDEDREALKDLGFVRGHSRAWTNGDDTHVVVLVYEWKDAKSPLLFVQGVQAVTEENATAWKPSLRRATGVCTGAGAGGEVDDSILVAVGKHSFLVIVHHEQGCDDHATVTMLADRIVEHAAGLGA